MTTRVNAVFANGTSVSVLADAFHKEEDKYIVTMDEEVVGVFQIDAIAGIYVIEANK